MSARILAGLAAALLAACSPERPRSTPPPEEPDSFGWGTPLDELCGKPFTTFSVPDGEYDCVRRGGVWTLRRVPA